MTPRQLTLDLPVRAAQGREDFFVAPSNALALEAIAAASDWPRGRLVLVGEPGCGKSHLAKVWQAESGARAIDGATLASRDPAVLLSTGALVVEDIDALAGDAAGERAFFHLVNMAEASGARLLLTARLPPGRLAIGLADLASRLQATQTARLAPPDDVLVAALLVKQFADRQLAVSPDVVAYLLRRIDRSAAAVLRIAEALDRAALEEKRRTVTRRLAAQVLARARR